MSAAVADVRRLRDRLLGAFEHRSRCCSALVALGGAARSTSSGDGVGRLSLAVPHQLPVAASPSRPASARAGRQHLRDRLTALIACRSASARRSTSRSTATRSRLARLIEINIANLAGVPSIIYGLLGLGLFVRRLGIGRSVLAGACTMALLVAADRSSSRRARRCGRCPTIAARGLLRARRHRWQTIWHQVLPAALPGILTGMILALSRAIGETAPLITIGALTYVPFAAGRPLVAVHRAADPDLQLGLPAAGGVPRRMPRPASSCCCALLLAMNAIAILLRDRFQRRGRS